MSKTVKNKRILVTGAGGFIGHHLVKFLKKKGYWVRGADIKFPEYEESAADEFFKVDLRKLSNCKKVTKGIDELYMLAADMGGMGYISFNNSLILKNNLLINTNTLEAARVNKIKKIFYSSSACVYPEFKQEKTSSRSLKESDAFPAQPQDAYGWEKLMTELALKYASEDYGIKIRIARFHNIYGPLGTWKGGREKAPAAVCRKIAEAKLNSDKYIEVWGDGKQTRSFCYIDDCIKGVYKLMQSDYSMTLNIGQNQMVSINKLVDIVSDISGYIVKKKHIVGPQGVRGRNSDNTLIMQVLGWQPRISLEEGLSKTYLWIEKQVNSQHLNEKE